MKFKLNVASVAAKILYIPGLVVACIAMTNPVFAQSSAVSNNPPAFGVSQNPPRIYLEKPVILPLRLVLLATLDGEGNLTSLDTKSFALECMEVREDNECISHSYPYADYVPLEAIHKVGDENNTRLTWDLFALGTTAFEKDPEVLLGQVCRHLQGSKSYFEDNVVRSWYSAVKCSDRISPARNLNR
jgi:hypothetical protein